MTRNYTIEKKQSNPLTSGLKIIPIILILVGVIGILLSSVISVNYLSFVGLLVISGSASLLCGVLLGFLFGIPRLNKTYNLSDNTNKQKYEPNTNLEEISDWLTKIIVGVSLTQITKIPSAIISLADFILIQNKCQFDCDFARAIVISVLLYFFIAGFLIGYFYTRILLPGLLSIGEQIQLLTEKEKVWKESYKQATNQNQEIDTSNENSSFKISALTEKEIEVIKKIINKENKYVLNELPTFEEFTAMDILIEKGIAVISHGETIRLGATLTIIDKDIIDQYKQ
ncbi:hypothetical protein [Flavobacterium mekongense]|uniref:hypothetical protein n=1 Tax=Flavobacterium mekongense TaxID=3379707 RepID=UPI00399A4E10